MGKEFGVKFMEFFMVYGWAIIVIIVIIVLMALYHFGLFK